MNDAKCFSLNQLLIDRLMNCQLKKLRISQTQILFWLTPQSIRGRFYAVPSPFLKVWVTFPIFLKIHE
jgi:hypothetical protein